MPDAKQTVANIRAFLQAPRAGVNAELVALAADYAEMCRETNFRLRRCADFLREGLRGEAVEYANARPPVLESVAELDFRELPDWDRICGTMGITRPTRLAIDSAHELRDACKKQEPLRELLGKHRYLALAHAPLGERVAVLHQLISLDPANPIWRQDAGDLERTSLAMLRNDAAAAIHAGDVATVDKLLAQVQTGQWMTAVPVELKETLGKASVTLHQATAVDDLRALLPSVREAYAAMSYEDCKRVFAQWGKVVKEAKLAVPPDLRQEILPLARWLDEQDDRRESERKFKTACEMLSAAIDSDAPQEHLTKLYRQAIGFEMDIPAELSSAYRTALEAVRREERADKKKQFALAAVLVGAIVVALIALAWVMFKSPK